MKEDNEGNTPKYDRIVPVGHGLCSVIAYDLLNFYWIESTIDCSFETNSAQLKQMEKTGAEVLASLENGKVTDFQIAPARSLADASPKCPWRITDFVTLGSPLTYEASYSPTAPEDLKLRKTQRELPTCSTQAENGSSTYSVDTSQ